MSHLRGMVVQLKTKAQSGAGTDDHLYIGVVGSGGGREFPLDVRDFNDFESGSDVKYWFGTVWDGTALAGARKPNRSDPGDRNDPAWHNVALKDVQTVYLRKQGSRSTDGDDAYKLDKVEVTLFGASPEKRIFSTGEDIWLGNEYGHQAWLPEEA
ncbi:MAG: hypothetical protein HY657_00005 [Acidobacteria bacterium]|nr:hypothetical protein [Acidobacteriota bacterium]